MPGRYMIPDWTPADILPALFPAVVAIGYGLYILAFPPSTSLGRKLCTFVLAIPVFFAFRHSEHAAPDFDWTDSYARASLIWFAHMSYEMCILEFTPDVQPGPGETKERLRQAYKVFFDRSHTQVLEEQRKRAMMYAKETKLSNDNDEINTATITVTDKKTDEQTKVPASKQQRTPLAHYQHGYTRWQFVRYHIVKFAILWVLYTSWEKYTPLISPLGREPWTYIGPDKIPFFSRLPGSLHWKEVYWRTEETLNWSVIGMWFYESLHSVFAALHVALGIDSAGEWSLALFGDIREAWTVRRYWSRYWHNYIYHSFMGHVKCMTRGWLRMKRGSLVTRLVENTLVFFFSGVMHSLVRWQEEPETDLWAVTLLYVAQMIPIVIEGVVAFYWRKVRRALGFGPDVKWMDRLEYAVGYFWCFAWMFYCVPTYWLVRDMWTEEKMEKAYLAKHRGKAFNQTALEE